MGKLYEYELYQYESKKMFLNLMYRTRDNQYWYHDHVSFQSSCSTKIVFPGRIFILSKKFNVNRKLFERSAHESNLEQCYPSILALQRTK